MLGLVTPMLSTGFRTFKNNNDYFFTFQIFVKPHIYRRIKTKFYFATTLQK